MFEHVVDHCKTARLVGGAGFWDKSRRHDGTFSLDDFAYDKDADSYTCSGGKRVKTTGCVHDGPTIYYSLASTFDCQICDLRARCCPRSPQRRIPRDVNEAARDYAKSLVGMAAYDTSLPLFLLHPTYWGSDGEHGQKVSALRQNAQTDVFVAATGSDPHPPRRNAKTQLD